MKTHTPSLLAFLLALAPLTAPAATLYTETFEEPSGTTCTFPPKNNWRDHLKGRLTGWSGDGAVAITYAEGLGKNESGGIKVALARVGTDFGFAKLQITVPGFTKGKVTAEQVKNLVLVFDIYGSQPLQVLTAVQTTLKDSWPSRLELSTLVLKPKWTTVRIPLTYASPEAIARFVEAINQTETANLNVHFYLADFSAWQEKDAFQLDNISLESATN